MAFHLRTHFAQYRNINKDKNMRTVFGLIALVTAYVISTATISVMAMRSAMHRTEQQSQKPGVPEIKRSSDTFGV
jgi:hypothetical protein